MISQILSSLNEEVSGELAKMQKTLDLYKEFVSRVGAAQGALEESLEDLLPKKAPAKRGPKPRKTVKELPGKRGEKTEKILAVLKDWLGVTEIEAKTGLGKLQIRSALGSLVKQGKVEVQGEGRGNREYRIKS